VSIVPLWNDIPEVMVAQESVLAFKSNSNNISFKLILNWLPKATQTISPLTLFVYSYLILLCVDVISECAFSSSLPSVYGILDSSG